MASYGAFDLGLVQEMNTIPNPKARQLNAYPGINGVEVLDHGSRGGVTVVLGVLGATTDGGLAISLQGLRDLQFAGTGNVLVDHFGEPFPGVILEQFAPVGRVYADASGYYQRYQCQFFHPL